jgi:hypothetical protein
MIRRKLRVYETSRSTSLQLIWILNNEALRLRMMEAQLQTVEDFELADTCKVQVWHQRLISQRNLVRRLEAACGARCRPQVGKDRRPEI